MKTVFFAVGNELKGDDGIGIYAGRKLSEHGFDVVFAHTAPENFTSKIPEGAEKIIVIDAAKFESDEPFVFGKAKGYFSTSHSVNFEMLEEITGLPVIVAGVAVYNTRLGAAVTKKALNNADLFIEHVLSVFGNCFEKHGKKDSNKQQ